MTIKSVTFTTSHIMPVDHLVLPRTVRSIRSDEGIHAYVEVTIPAGAVRIENKDRSVTYTWEEE